MRETTTTKLQHRFLPVARGPCFTGQLSVSLPTSCRSAVTLCSSACEGLLLQQELSQSNNQSKGTNGESIKKFSGLKAMHFALQATVDSQLVALQDSCQKIIQR